MPDETTKPIAESNTEELPNSSPLDSESFNTQSKEEGTIPIEKSSPVLITSEPEVVVDSETVQVGSIPESTPISNSEPSVITKHSSQEANPMGDGTVGGEPTGEAGGSDTVSTELPNEVSRPYSLDPKLNKTIEGFVRNMNKAKENLILANASIKAKMMKRVYKVMDLFKKKKKIKNDDVERLIHTDDSTATKYLNILTKEGKIKREGNIHAPHYTKIE